MVPLYQVNTVIYHKTWKICTYEACKIRNFRQLHTFLRKHSSTPISIKVFIMCDTSTGGKLTYGQRSATSYAFLRQMEGAKLQYGALQEVANEFKVNRRTLNKIWNQEQVTEDIFLLAGTYQYSYSGTRRTKSDAMHAKQAIYPQLHVLCYRRPTSIRLPRFLNLWWEHRHMARQIRGVQKVEQKICDKAVYNEASTT